VKSIEQPPLVRTYHGSSRREGKGVVKALFRTPSSRAQLLLVTVKVTYRNDDDLVDASEVIRHRSEERTDARSVLWSGAGEVRAILK